MQREQAEIFHAGLHWDLSRLRWTIKPKAMFRAAAAAKRISGSGHEFNGLQAVGGWTVAMVRFRFIVFGLIAQMKNSSTTRHLAILDDGARSSLQDTLE